MKLLQDKIVCTRTLSLVKKGLVVGYLDPKTKRITKSDIGTPLCLLAGYSSQQQQQQQQQQQPLIG